MSTSTPPVSLSPARRAGHSSALWVFGVFTTLLLIGLWGRSVATDRATLADSARAVLESELVNDRVDGWLADGLQAAAQLSPAAAQDTVGALENDPGLEDALDRLVDETVSAALAPPDQPRRVDVADALDPAFPAIMEALQTQGISADEADVRDTITRMANQVLGTDTRRFVSASSAAGANSMLSKVLVLGLVGMVVAGAAATRFSDDPRRQLRNLGFRVAVSAATFAVILRAGAWAVDPEGGRSPLAAGSAVLLRSNGHVLATVAILAAVGAGLASLFVTRSRRTN